MEYRGCGSVRLSLYNKSGCQTLSNAWLISTKVAVQSSVYVGRPHGFCALVGVLVLWFHVVAEIRIDDPESGVVM